MRLRVASKDSQKKTVISKREGTIFSYEITHAKSFHFWFYFCLTITASGSHKGASQLTRCSWLVCNIEWLTRSSKVLLLRSLMTNTHISVKLWHLPESQNFNKLCPQNIENIWRYSIVNIHSTRFNTSLLFHKGKHKTMSPFRHSLPFRDFVVHQLTRLFLVLATLGSSGPSLHS